MGAFRRIALALVIIGAINWGLIGFFKFDLVASIFGGQTAFLSRVIYALVGLSGLASLGILFSPMEEEVVVERERRPRESNLNYNTEFGEETDIAKARELAKKKANANTSQQPYKKKK